jgi:hypothetical protein
MRYRTILPAGVLLMLIPAMTATVFTQARGQTPVQNPGQGPGQNVQNVQNVQGRGGGQGRGAPPPPARPTPRWPDGHVKIGQVEGEPPGLWQLGGVPLARADKPSDFGLFAADMREPTDPFLASKPKLSQIPFQPWARALFANRVQIRNEPYVRCKPSSGARQVGTAYGTQLLEDRELKRFYIFETGGAHSFRTVYMDGRAHAPNLSPSYRGESIGHWEGDTLVVDTVGFNEGMWIDNLGVPTTDQLHLIEKFTRTDFATIRYEITIDDPGAYTAPWRSPYLMRWTSGEESFEFVCQDNNEAPGLIVGDGTFVLKPPLYVP